ncbi:MAG TPA: PIN domain-containing protein [Acidimicrobiales bacterium]|nr:PIN domain-containing protein [Acidimicrobiales bacterium]
MPAVADPSLSVDTSLALPLLLRNHEAHQRSTEWRAGRRLSIAGHAWIETYAVLTRLPGAARLLPGDAVRLLKSNFSEPLPPSPHLLANAVELFATAGIAGGATYDGWIALAALEHQVVLASRDLRAESTYRRLGVEVELVI